MDVVFVGLGSAAAIHLAVLEEIDDVEVVAGIDPKPRYETVFRGRPLPVYPSVWALPDGGVEPELVVVATPTASHVSVCGEVSDRFPNAKVLVEKPAADNLEDLHRMFHPAADRRNLTVGYHLSFSAEVFWGAELAAARGTDLGEPTRFEQLFCDPYAADHETMTARHGTSWQDSGINALSIIQRFADPIERTSLRTLDPAGLTFEARVRCRTRRGADAEALVVTSWRVGAPSRTTRVEFASGTHLVLDHVGVAGYLFQAGNVVETFGSDGTVSRGHQRYRALYRSFLGDAAACYDTDTTLRLSRILSWPAD